MNRAVSCGSARSRISRMFEQLRQRRRKGLIPFITAGYPNPELTVPLMHRLVNAGADLIELGVPFSDPMADGPVIQRASDLALKQGVSLASVLWMVKEFRRQNQATPVLLMGYLNPVEKMGYRSFAEQAAGAGVDGVLVVDLPAEDATDYSALLRAHDLDSIFLLAPNTSAERVEVIAKAGTGFLYYVALKGVTGAGHLDSDQVELRIAQCRKWTDLPIVTGFGISNAASAAAIAGFSDAVVVGSALLRNMELLQAQGLGDEALLDGVAAFLGELRRAVDQVGELA